MYFDLLKQLNVLMKINMCYVSAYFQKKTFINSGLSQLPSNNKVNLKLVLAVEYLHKDTATSCTVTINSFAMLQRPYVAMSHIKKFIAYLQLLCISQETVQNFTKVHFTFIYLSIYTRKTFKDFKSIVNEISYVELSCLKWMIC